jgi:hypothetical protein
VSGEVLTAVHGSSATEQATDEVLGIDALPGPCNPYAALARLRAAPGGIGTGHAVAPVLRRLFDRISARDKSCCNRVCYFSRHAKSTNAITVVAVGLLELDAI